VHFSLLLVLVVPKEASNASSAHTTNQESNWLTVPQNFGRHRTATAYSISDFGEFVDFGVPSIPGMN
jgi:hypothetical protein